MKAFFAIVATAKNGAIGKGNTLPWHYPEDFKWFKACTEGQIVVMGRKTLESLPKREPLPNRETWVLSRNTHFNTHTPVSCLNSLKALEEKAAGEYRQIWICGGSCIYKAILKRCQKVYLTSIEQEIPDADSFFPLETLKKRFKKIKARPGKTPELEFSIWENPNPESLI